MINRFVLLVALLLPIVSVASSAEEPALPFTMPIPDGWKTETIPFPLRFAPQVDYEGVEELRFAPGMFKPESEEFWSYAFVWWVPAATAISAETLRADLNAYYRGLASEPENPKIHTKITLMDDPAGGPQRFEGTLETIDSFVTKEPVSLNVHIEVIACEMQGQIGVFFELSPQPQGHAVWEQLRGIREGFRCGG